jgi:hypothetical protein
MVAWHEVPGKCGYTDPSRRVRYEELPWGRTSAHWLVYGLENLRPWSDATSGDTTHIRRGGSTRMIQIRVLRSRLEKQPTDPAMVGRKPRCLWEDTRETH